MSPPTGKPEPLGKGYVVPGPPPAPTCSGCGRQWAAIAIRGHADACPRVRSPRAGDPPDSLLPQQPQRPTMWPAEPYAVTRLDALRKLRSEGYAVDCVVCDVAHAGSCENCGKPMAEHGPMANCYPPSAARGDR